jgi:hypothetical protein
VCLYCGYGSVGKEDDDSRFDLWRQLAVEHIVPHEGTANKKNILGGIQSRFALPKTVAEEVYKAINDMNTVSACRSCNNFAHEGGKHVAKGTAIRFRRILGCDAAEDRPRRMDSPKEWIASLQQTIRETWDRKRHLVRPKVVWLRKEFSKVAPALGSACSGSERKILLSPTKLDDMVYKRMERSAKKAMEILEAACRERGAG